MQKILMFRVSNSDKQKLCALQTSNTLKVINGETKSKHVQSKKMSKGVKVDLGSFLGRRAGAPRRGAPCCRAHHCAALQCITE